MNLVIDHFVHLDNKALVKDGKPSLTGALPVYTAEEVYRIMQYNYPKFFKMDLLCKWAWLGAEALLDNGNGYLYDGIDKTKIGVVLSTASGCLDVDRKYLETTNSIASPGLFVYTLPNIMLGEICIRHGFKGEQSCMISGSFNTEETFFWVNDLLQNRGMEACLCGWVEATGDKHDVCLFWIRKNNNGTTFSAANLQQLYTI